MIWNTLVLAVKQMQRNAMRSFLTVLGVVIGVSAVITMVTLGNGATKAVSDQIASLGSNLLIAMPGQRFGAGSAGASAQSFKLSDAEAIRSQIGGLKAVAPTASESVTVVSAGKNWTMANWKFSFRTTAPAFPPNRSTACLKDFTAWTRRVRATRAARVWGFRL